MLLTFCLAACPLYGTGLGKLCQTSFMIAKRYEVQGDYARPECRRRSKNCPRRIFTEGLRQRVSCVCCLRFAC